MFTVGIIAMTAVLGAIERAVFPVTECEVIKIEPIHLNFHKIAAYGRLNVLYGPATEGIDSVERMDLVYTRKNSYSYTVVNTTYFKDNTTDKQTSTQYLEDDYILEDGADAGDPVNTRFIVAPTGRFPSDEDLKQLFDADKKHDFRGSFHKFKYELS